MKRDDDDITGDSGNTAAAIADQSPKGVAVGRRGRGVLVMLLLFVVVIAGGGRSGSGRNDHDVLATSTKLSARDPVRSSGSSLVASPTATPAVDPNTACLDSDTPTATKYRPILEQAIADIAVHLGRSLELKTYLSVNNKQLERDTALAYVKPCGDQTTLRVPVCTIHINPLSFQDGWGEGDLPETLIHEAWHCYQFDTSHGRETQSLPPWLLEGSAAWVAATLRGGRTTKIFWRFYLLNHDLSLFKRANDALGYYARLAETGTDVWSRLDPMMAAYLNGPQDDLNAGDRRAWEAAKPTNEFLTSWGAGFAQGRRAGTQWDITTPGLPGDKPPPTIRAVTNDTTTPVSVATDVAGARLIQLDVTAEVVSFAATGDTMPSGLVGIGDDADMRIQDAVGNDYCTNKDRCTCPKDSPSEGLTLTWMSPGTGYIGITGGLAKANVDITGSSFDDFCNKPKRPKCPNQPATGNYACFDGPDLHGTIIGATACNLDGLGTLGLGDLAGGAPVLGGLEVDLYIQLDDRHGNAPYLNPLVGPPGGGIHNSVGVSPLGSVHGNGRTGYFFDRARVGPYTISGALGCDRTF